MGTEEKRITKFPRADDGGTISYPQEVSTDCAPLRHFAAQDKGPAKLKRKRHEPPPRLPLKAVPTVLTKSVPRKKGTNVFCKQASPWTEYHSLLNDDEAGPATIAHEHDLTFAVVAIKERAIKDESLVARLLRVQHGNVVHLLRAFLHNSTLFLVYESVAVSLTEIQSCPYGPLKEFEIATICQEVCMLPEPYHFDFRQIKLWNR
jgi:hypothetical protein